MVQQRLGGTEIANISQAVLGEYRGSMNKSKKQITTPEKSKEVTYKCLKCSYVFNKESSDVPPTFCPNCAINHLKGEIVRVMQLLDYEID